jgi:multisubunit Na+/H+ antiporter MnhB subunit
VILIVIHFDWNRIKEMGWRKILFYSAALIVALVGLCILISLITLVLLERFDDRYKESHPEEFGRAVDDEVLSSLYVKEE